jgi:hypothetical protein
MIPKHRFGLLAIIFWLFFMPAVVSVAGLRSNGFQPSVQQKIRNAYIEKPTDVIHFNGKFISTELKNHRLAIFYSFHSSQVDYFDPIIIGKKFHSPHFLAVSPWNTLLISNGWGKSIVEIDDLEGNGWKTFSGLENNRFNAPHGIAVDTAEGWIYVGDSLNSRIVRFKDMHGGQWQVFKDHEKKVAYSRQLVFKNGALWISNSYENRPGLNHGKGSNVLRIDDFGSGLVTEMYRNSRDNITGICPMEGILIVAVWGHKRRLIAKDLATGKEKTIADSRNEFGTPYGIYVNPLDGNIITTYFGDFRQNIGGFLILN